MKILLLCLLFLPIVYLALQQKKWYLCLLFAFLSVLPEQFAVDLHEKLPLISGGRLLIVLVFGFWVWNRWKEKRLTVPKSLMAFFLVNVVISLVNFRFGFGEINRIFLLVFERVLLVVMLADLIGTREDFDTCADFLILGGAALAVVGIFQTVFEYDITTPLHWVETLGSIQLSVRMGLTRAAGTYNAISFGCWCTVIALVILYRLYHTRRLWYASALALVIAAMICSLSRSAWLALLGILAIMVLFTRFKLVSRSALSLGLTVVLIISLMFFQPNLKNAFIETGKSTINTVLDVLPDEAADKVVDFLTKIGLNPNPDPENHGRLSLDDEFGLNGEDPTYSRMAQWTAVKHMVQEGNGLFGLGYNAVPEGRVYFFFDRWGGKWEQTAQLDVGLVALFLEGGFIGGISYLALLLFMMVCAFHRRDRKDPMDFYHITVYTVPLLLLLNFLASFMFEELVWIFTAMFYAYHRVCNGGGKDALTLPKRIEN